MTTDPIAAARALLDARPAQILNYERDLMDMVATLADAVEAERAKAKAERLVLKALLEGERAKVAAAQMTMRERCSFVADDRRNAASKMHMGSTTAYFMEEERRRECETIARAILATPINNDAQAALDKLLSEARREGWRAGRDQALVGLAAVQREVAYFSATHGNMESVEERAEGGQP